ncbi:hypothetical protein JTB14_007365 [Gonioctena quinquepunctata]|nr:hypothetical protein JTB14_007365 [Gonioctena quinquepunctata]
MSPTKNMLLTSVRTEYFGPEIQLGGANQGLHCFMTADKTQRWQHFLLNTSKRDTLLILEAYRSKLLSDVLKRLANSSYPLIYQTSLCESTCKLTYTSSPTYVVRLISQLRTCCKKTLRFTISRLVYIIDTEVPCSMCGLPSIQRNTGK